MRQSSTLIPTLREVPADADIKAISFYCAQVICAKMQAACTAFTAW